MRTHMLMQELRGRLRGRPVAPAPRGLTRDAGDVLRARPQRPRGAGRPQPSPPAGWPQLPTPPQPSDPRLLAQLKAATICQIGVGRAGVRQRTATLLKFLGDRAVAVEAVRSELPEDFARRIGAAVEVQTHARDLDEFLLRPDLGRSLPDGELDRVRAACPHGVDVQVLVGDGLSANAVILNAPPFLQAFQAECARLGLRVGETVLVRRARVKVMDPVGQALGARTAIHLIGERPGLGTGDGMSAYLIHDPRDAALDSDREVVSNIHGRGEAPDAAGRRVAAMLVEFLRVGMSGVKRQANGGGSAPDPREAARAEPSRLRDPVAERHAPAYHLDERGEPRRYAPPPLASSAAARCGG